MTRLMGLRRLAMAVVAFLATVLVVQAAMAEEPKGFKCKFTGGVVSTFEKGAFHTKPAQELDFEIGDIDLRTQTASLVTPKGKGDLKLVRAIGANHFLEVITEGFLNITTIYEPSAPGLPYPAAHSRHFGLLGTPVVSQYYGSCVPH